MPETEKPNWGNRIILIIMIGVAIITIGATIFATTTEWYGEPLPAETVEAQPDTAD